MNVSGQHDWQDERLTGQIPDQAGHCLLTGRYFEPWPRRKTPVVSGRILCSHMTYVLHTARISDVEASRLL